jgi:ArsR family transcriptional regulator, arsenate/arsenite/antimonite-responsive transcriptional repressor
MSIQDAADTACCAPGPVQAAGAGSGGALIRQPIDETAAVELARVFKALADPARLRLLSLIGAHAGGEVCVCDLTAAFDLTQPTISHHLKTLREAGLIGCQRRGTWVYYWLIPAAMERVSALLSAPVPASA